jgi:cysteine desulfurase
MIYLDYNATTPLLAEAWEAMQPFFSTRWGNPSSAYRFGAQLKAEVERAREAVASLVGAEEGEIVFTSCATESNNAAMNAALAAKPNSRHIVTSVAEHSAVLNYCKAAERRGYRVTYLGVDADGLCDLEEFVESINDDTALVSLMWANNETGVLFPVEAIARVCHERGVLFHCDAVQAVGKIPVDVSRVEADYLTISAHKLYGPKGIGALCIRNRVPFEPMVIGGHQEGGRRGGTENVGLIAGFGVAAEYAKRMMSERAAHTRRLRDKLENEVLQSIAGSRINGSRTRRVPNTTNIGFDGIDSDAMVAFLDNQGVCVSSGSACLANALSPSHVVLAMTQSVDKAKQAIRFSLSHLTEGQDITECVEKLRQGGVLLREGNGSQ